MADDKMDELIQQMAALGISPDMLGVLGRQANQGEAWMNSPSPEGRTVGHTYVASSPLEHLASALRQGVGGSRYNAAVGGMKDQLAQNKQGIAAYGSAQKLLYDQALEEAKKRAAGQSAGWAAGPEDGSASPVPVAGGMFGPGY